MLRNGFQSRTPLRTFPAHLLLAFLLPALLAVWGCSSRIDLPAITPDAGHLRYPGKFVWFDLYTTDIDAAAQFYDRVLGWSVERADPGSPRVKTILNGNHRIGSVFLIGGRGGEPGWVPSLSVADADAAHAAALRAGARSVRPPKDRPYRGRSAEIRDPQNARLELLVSSVGDPRDRAPEEGAFMGAELWTPAPDAAVKFYTGLAGYRAARLNLRHGPYVMLLGDNRPRAGITAPLAPVSAPLWIPQVAVRDVAGVIRRVETFGGTVLLRPAPGDKTNPVAVFRDPAGGLMGVRGFTPVED